jgi:hypothetical protein
VNGCYSSCFYQVAKALIPCYRDFTLNRRYPTWKTLLSYFNGQHVGENGIVMSSIPPFSPASVLDIVSFGYRRLFQCLKPLTLLASPFVLLAALVEAWFFPNLGDIQEQSSTTDVFSFFSADPAGYTAASYGMTFLMILLLFSYLRYIRDVYTNTPKAPLQHYLMPNRRLWGIVGFSLLLGLGLIIGIVIMVMGLFLLVLPGLAILTGIVYLLVRISMILPAYTHHTGQGLGQSLAESWRLTRGHFWRTLGMLALVEIINFLIVLPFVGVGAAVGLFSSALNTFAWPMTFLYYLLYHWAYYTLIIGGMTFVLYRYYFDLQVGRGENEGAF